MLIDRTSDLINGHGLLENDHIVYFDIFLCLMSLMSENMLM